MESFEVPDGNGRALRFEGELLGFASSERPREEACSRAHCGRLDCAHKDRWSEVSIYRTRAGSYVVALVGRSRRAGEVDFHRAQVSDLPDGAIEFLHKYDGDGARYLPWVHREALSAACAADRGLAGAFAVEHIA